VRGPIGTWTLRIWLAGEADYRPHRAAVQAQIQGAPFVLPTFRHLQEQLSRQLEQASGLDLAHIKVPAPEVRLLGFNLEPTNGGICGRRGRYGITRRFRFWAQPGSDRVVTGLRLYRDPSQFRKCVYTSGAAEPPVARGFYTAEWHLCFVVHRRTIHVADT